MVLVTKTETHFLNYQWLFFMGTRSKDNIKFWSVHVWENTPQWLARLSMMSTASVSRDSKRANLSNNDGKWGHQINQQRKWPWRLKGVQHGHIQFLSAAITGRSSVSNCDLILDMKTVFHNVDLVFTSEPHDHCVLQSSNLSDVIYQTGKREKEVLKAEELTFLVWAELSFMTHAQKTATVNNSATQSPDLKSEQGSFNTHQTSQELFLKTSAHIGILHKSGRYKKTDIKHHD